MSFIADSDNANRREQSLVYKYIKDHFIPNNSNTTINFFPTRKININFLEDEITYTRNLLGHNAMEVPVSYNEIVERSAKLTEVLCYFLNNNFISWNS